MGKESWFCVYDFSKSFKSTTLITDRLREWWLLYWLLHIYLVKRPLKIDHALRVLSYSKFNVNLLPVLSIQFLTLRYQKGVTKFRNWWQFFVSGVYLISHPDTLIPDESTKIRTHSFQSTIYHHVVSLDNWALLFTVSQDSGASIITGYNLLGVSPCDGLIFLPGGSSKFSNYSRSIWNIYLCTIIEQLPWNYVNL